MLTFVIIIILICCMTSLLTFTYYIKEQTIERLSTYSQSFNMFNNQAIRSKDTDVDYNPYVDYKTYPKLNKTDSEYSGFKKYPIISMISRSMDINAEEELQKSDEIIDRTLNKNNSDKDSDKDSDSDINTLEEID